MQRGACAHASYARGMRVLATTSHKAKAVHDADLTGPCALLIGNEGAGLPRDLLTAADERIAVPQAPQVESLNAAIAASILLYEASRQRTSLTTKTRRHEGEQR